jgi:hypothetical protein
MARTFDCYGYEGCRYRVPFGQINQKMISRMRSTSSRGKADRNTDTISGWYPSRKMPGLVRAESNRTELPYFLVFELNEDFINQFDKPP